jgi:hypothetical protein
MRFYENNFDMDLLVPDDDGLFLISQVKWDNIYKKYMDQVRPYVKEHSNELLDGINSRLIDDVWNKYCLGSESRWEMDSVSFYNHPHELLYADLDNYQVVNFNELNEDPDIDRVITMKGKQIPLFKIYRIAGTVLDKDKAKKMITLLTTEGVVTVKIYGGVFMNYDKQISERGMDGKKHVIEKSWFSRGNKLIVTGIRQGDSFIAKKYSRTPYHLIELIEEVNEDGSVRVKEEREGVE